MRDLLTVSRYEQHLTESHIGTICYELRAWRSANQSPVVQTSGIPSLRQLPVRCVWPNGCPLLIRGHMTVWSYLQHLRLCHLADPLGNVSFLSISL